MAAPRTYTAEDALTITAFPLSDQIGYIIRVGDGDHDGVILGSVFRVGDGWRAYGLAATGGPSPVLGSADELDDLVVEHYLAQVRLADDLDG